MDKTSGYKLLCEVGAVLSTLHKLTRLILATTWQGGYSAFILQTRHCKCRGVK